MLGPSRGVDECFAKWNLSALSPKPFDKVLECFLPGTWQVRETWVVG